MPETDQTDSNQKKVGDKKKQVFDPGMKRILGWGLAALAVLLVFTFVQRAGRIPFFTENFLSLVLLMVIVVQACIYSRQWEVMRRQWIAMRRGLVQTRNIVGQNERVIEKMQGQLDAVTDQAGIMRDSLTETRNIIDQNERSLRAYFGVRAMTIEPLTIGARPRIWITFVNGGQTPAWHFNAWFIGLIVDTQPLGDPWTVEESAGDIGNSFVPAGAEKTIVYDQTEFIVTRERLDAIKDRERMTRLFVFGDAHYNDISGGPKKSFHFCGVYDPDSRKFRDYEV